MCCRQTSLVCQIPLPRQLEKKVGKKNMISATSQDIIEKSGYNTVAFIDVSVVTKPSDNATTL